MTNIDDLMGNVYLTSRYWRPIANRPFIVIRKDPQYRYYYNAIIKLLEEPNYQSGNTWIEKGHASIMISSIRQCKIVSAQSIMTVIKHRLMRQGLL